MDLVQQRRKAAAIMFLLLLLQLYVLLRKVRVLLVRAHERSPTVNHDLQRNNKLCRLYLTSDITCYAQLRMRIAPFQRLVARLRGCGLADSQFLSAEEQVAIFLSTVGHDIRYRRSGHDFIRSSQTVSRYFHNVLEAVLRLYKDVVTPTQPGNSPRDGSTERDWHHHFADGRVIADDAVWGPYIEAHPKAKILRTIRILHYDKLGKIFGNDTANGEMCMEGNDEDVTRNTEPIDLCDENPGDDNQGNVSGDLESTHGPSSSTAHTKPPVSRKRRRSLTGLDQFDESCDKIAAVASDIASSLKVVNRLPDVMFVLMKIPELTDEERMVALDIMGRQIGLVDIFFALEERMRLPWILRQLAHLA